MVTYETLCQHFRDIIADIHRRALATTDSTTTAALLKNQDFNPFQNMTTLFFDDDPDAIALGNQVGDYAMQQQVNACPYIRVKPHEGFRFPFIGMILLN